MPAFADMVLVFVFQQPGRIGRTACLQHSLLKADALFCYSLGNVQQLAFSGSPFANCSGTQAGKLQSQLAWEVLCTSPFGTQAGEGGESSRNQRLPFSRFLVLSAWILLFAVS
jgi:hypothetical protein